MTQQHIQRTHTETEAPEGSYWPIVLAATLTMTVVGLIVHFAVTLAGVVLSILTIAAWTIERFQGIPQLGQAQTERVEAGISTDGIALEMPGEGGRSANWWGLVWFIATEALFFGNLIVAYLFLRLGLHGTVPPHLPHRELLFPSLNTVVLLASGIPAYFGSRAMKRGNSRGLVIGFVLSALLGALFLAGQGYEYSTAGFTLQNGILAAGFFVLTGFHGFHVAVGIGVLLFVSLLSLRGRFTAQRHFAVEVASTYWHFVDLVWIFLFTLLYLMQ